MVGKYYLRVDSGNLEYSMKFKRNVTILKGDSGAGKSTLIQLLSEYLHDTGSFISVDTDAKGVFVLDSLTEWQDKLHELEGYLIFADEDVPYITRRAFSAALQKSKNYFIFITRDKRLANLSYSVNEMYRINTISLGDKTINNIDMIYKDFVEDVHPDIIVTEDSKSGHDLVEKLFGGKCDVVTSNGKDNMYRFVDNIENDKCIYVIVDGAAFDSRISELCGLMQYKDVHIFAPESFEYLLLCVSVFRNLTHGELDETYNYVHSSKYVTWENYFEELLRLLCRKLGTRYKKDRWDKLSYIFKQGSFLKELKSEFKDLNGGM